MGTDCMIRTWWSRNRTFIITEPCHAPLAFQSTSACHALLLVQAGWFSAIHYKSFNDILVADPGGRAVLKRGSAATRLLGLQVRIPPGAWMSVSLNIVCCCQVEVSATG
jgi:hypothetical protein